MKNNTKAIIGLVIAIVVVLGIWFAVGRPPAEEPAADVPAPAPAPAPAPTPAPVEPADIYPLDTDVVLTYWLALPAPHVSANFTNYAETPLYKEVFERTGVTVEFQHPPEGQATEQFNLMVASGDLPDIIEWGWATFPGGPAKAIADGLIRPLNDIFESYAPNVSALLEENPQWARQAMTDDGTFYMFPFIRDDRDGDNRLMVSTGIFLRYDWLTALNLPLPETYDDWRTVLTAFRDQKGATAPLSHDTFMTRDHFQTGFGVNMGFFLEGEEVVFGPMQPGFREWLELYRDWYADGLIDPEIATVDRRALEAKILGGQTGATIGAMVGRLGFYTHAMRETDPNVKFMGTVNPTRTRGEQPLFGMGPLSQGTGAIGTGAQAAITTGATDEEVEIAARFLDFNYSPEGYILFSFGIEGESFTMVDGVPTYTDMIYNHPEGWPIAEALSAFARAPANGPFLQSKEYIWQYAYLPEQKASWENWEHSMGQLDGQLRWLPRITPTSEEANELAAIMSQVNTLRDETVLRIMTGAAPIEAWDTFVETIKGMGIERAIEIQEAGVQRFKNRP